MNFPLDWRERSIFESRGVISRPGVQGSAEEFIRALLVRPDGSVDGLAVAMLHCENTGRLLAGLEVALRRPADEIEPLLARCLEQVPADELMLTGAEATAVILRQEGVRTVFAYAGTSELALCDGIGRVPGVTLVNGRGDSASAFMAAGSSLLTPCQGVAVLHGARGLTHATGAIANARRNEVGLVVIVGLPSTRSAPFLPPHGELDLIAKIGSFAKWSQEIGPVPLAAPDRLDHARRYIGWLRSAFARSRTPPAGPSLIGIPQDVAEAAWLPLAALDAPATRVPAPIPSAEDLDAATRMLEGRRQVVIIIDDYLLRYGQAKPALAGFSARAGAVVLQVRYRRGAMLFERLRTEDVPAFAGWYDPQFPAHQALLANASLLVTVEDRNLYERVVGTLPSCRKLAITSDADKAGKNQYLRDGDVVLEGNPVTILQELAERLGPRTSKLGLASGETAAIAEAGSTPAVQPGPVAKLRAGIVGALADAARGVAGPVIVDDSQMFGGLVSSQYDRLPCWIRVFGDHCGFVGGGISYATGLAISDPSVTVFCLLGDQAFTNGLQGLAAAGQERPPIVYLVCNNGKSVSLLTQAAKHPEWFDGGRHPHLWNPPNMDYVAAARSLGVDACRVAFTLDSSELKRDRELRKLRRSLVKALNSGGPALIEMQLPESTELWDGIWLDRGFDEAVRPEAGGRTHDGAS